MRLRTLLLRYPAPHPGSHKCPRQQLKGDFDTSYANHYKNFTVAPQIVKPRHVVEERHYNPESLRTHYQEAYVERERAEPLVGSASRLENVGVFGC